MNGYGLMSIISAVLLIMYYLFVYIPRQQRKRFSMKLRDRGEIQDILDEIRDTTNIERALIWSCNNGRGMHSFGFQMYTGVEYYSYKGPFSSDEIKSMRGLTVEGNDIKTIQRIYDNKSTAFFTDQMPEGFFRNIDEKQGVRWSAFYALGEDKIRGVFYYMSVSTTKETTPFQNGNGVFIELAVNKMKNIFKRLYKNPMRRLREKLYI